MSQSGPPPIPDDPPYSPASPTRCQGGINRSLVFSFGVPKERSTLHLFHSPRNIRLILLSAATAIACHSRDLPFGVCRQKPRTGDLCPESSSDSSLLYSRSHRLFYPRQKIHRERNDLLWL